MAEFRGVLQGGGRKIALVVSRFNESVTHALRSGAVAELVRHGVSAGDIDIFEVPGAFELPGVAARSRCPVVFGVLTCDTEEQARERAGGKSGNKGADCARAALELIDLYRQIG